MTALGYHDLRSTKTGDEAQGFLEQLESALLPNLSDETLVSIRHAASAFVMLAGVGMCVAVLCA